MVRPALFPAALVPAILVLFGPLAPARASDDVPAPRVDGIDYARPEAHLDLSPHMGSGSQIRALADQLRADAPRATLAAIAQWMHRNLRHQSTTESTWRTFEQMLADRWYGGCADHAALFGTLARAGGVPTVWVKTMDVGWIHDFQAGRAESRQYRGHVFLEVHLEGRWHLLDATAMHLWSDYDPDRRILPGYRLAYDKGDDPHDLVLSCRWDLWLQQTHEHFRRLDPAALPWGRRADLLAAWRVYVAGSRPRYGYAQSACKALGYHVEMTFNTAYDRILPRARGTTLIVTCDGREPSMPAALRDAWLPPVHRDLAAGGAPPASGWAARRLDDGTYVVLVTAQDYEGVQRAVAEALRQR